MSSRTVVNPSAADSRSRAARMRSATPRPGAGVDPHSRDLADVWRSERLQDAAARGLAPDASDHRAGRVRRPHRGVESLLEALVELGVVTAKAPADVGRSGLRRLDGEHRPSQQPAHLVLGPQQPLALRAGERREHHGRQLVGGTVDIDQLRPPGPRRQPKDAWRGGRPGTGARLRPARRAACPKQPREVARVQPEARPQVARSGALEADLVEDARLAEGPPRQWRSPTTPAWRVTRRLKLRIRAMSAALPPA